MLRQLIAKLERTGTVADEKVDMKTKQNTASSPENIIAARTIMKVKPSSSSARHLAQQLGISVQPQHRE